MLLRLGERVFIGHTGGMPGHITGTFLHRESGTAGLALMNTTSSPDPAALATDLLLKVLTDDPVQPKPWIPGTEVPADLVPVLGTWFSEGNPFVFSVRDGKLQATAPGAPDWKPPAVFEKISEDLYRTTSGREAGELLRITRDTTNTPTTLPWATSLCTREPLAFGEWL
jgi:hypothetical protein